MAGGHAFILQVGWIGFSMLSQPLSQDAEAVVKLRQSFVTIMIIPFDGIAD